MKKYILSIFSFFALICFGYSQDVNPLVLEDGRIEVVMSNDLSKDDLMKLKDDLLSLAKITIQYDVLDYNKKGKIKNIRFSVDCHDGFAGEYGIDRIGDDFKFGFYRDYRTGAASPFGLRPYPFDQTK